MRLRFLVGGLLTASILTVGFYLSGVSSAPLKLPYLHAPAGKQFARVVPDGVTILPNGRFLTPKGERLYTGADLWNVALSPNGKILVGFFDGGLGVYALPHVKGAVPRLLPNKDLHPVGIFTKDGSRLIVSNGDGNGIDVWDTSGWDTAPTPEGDARFVTSDVKPKATITANDAAHNASYINDLALSPDEKFAYGVDVAHQRVVVFDLAAGKAIRSEKAGREPYALTLSGDGKRLYIANIGLFDYSVVPPPATPADGTPRGLSQPAFAFPSKESETGVKVEGRTVPGLGSPYVADAQSVWMYDLTDPATPKLAAQAKAGLLIHAPSEAGKAVGGSAPNKLLLRGDRLFVSNANNDTVQVFDARTLKSRKTIKISPSPLVAKLRGVIPSGMVLDKAGKRLYVSESGLNAVAVIDVEKEAVVGHIPTGWFPIQLALAPDEKTLYIGTQKGIGRGPRGPKREPTDERYGLTDMPGMVGAVTIPTDATLAAWTAEVLANNGIADRTSEVASRTPGVMPFAPGKPSEQIKYVVFITKENHTFDGIFGGLKGAEGEPKYAEFGMQGWIREKGQTERVPIMPNHLRLAEQFAISDNFYMEPQASGDGHRWLIGVYPSLWTSRVFYSGWNFKLDDKAKGRLVSFGSNGSEIPEDYLENGSMWEHLGRGGITFRNYGEGYELPGTDEDEMTNKTGQYYPINNPMPKVLYDNTCFNFPAYNNNIPDIARYDWFKEDLEKYRKTHSGKIPQFLNIAICNDHGTKANPKRGYPYTCSYMADNDLALGRIVEYLSHTAEWKNMAIFVTQDDSGGDNDHIDRHRSFVLAISPYAKKGYVSRDHTSIMSIIKSIYRFYGLGPNNMFDAVATDLSDMFTTTPDFTPYTAALTDARVFIPEDTFDPTDPKFERRRRERPSIAMDDPEWEETLHKGAPKADAD